MCAQVGEIVARFEKRGFKLVALKLRVPARSLAEAHYADLKAKPFFGGLCDFICSGPVCCMVWEGKDVVKQARRMIGETNPLASNPGSIRGDFAFVSRSQQRLSCAVFKVFARVCQRVCVLACVWMTSPMTARRD